MNDSAIKAMFAIQYGWYRRDIDVEYLSSHAGETEFVVRYVPYDERIPPTKLHLTIKIEELK